MPDPLPALARRVAEKLQIGRTRYYVGTPGSDGFFVSEDRTETERWLAGQRPERWTHGAEISARFAPADLLTPAGMLLLIDAMRERHWFLSFNSCADGYAVIFVQRPPNGDGLGGHAAAEAAEAPEAVLEAAWKALEWEREGVLPSLRAAARALEIEESK